MLYREFHMFYFFKLRIGHLLFIYKEKTNLSSE